MFTHSYLLDVNEYLKSNETLQALYNDGIIDLGNVELKMNKDIEALKEQVKKIHPYSWGLYSGRWRTYVSDCTSKTGRKLIYAPTEIALLDKIIEHYSDDRVFTQIPTIEKLYPLWLNHKEIVAAETSIIKINFLWKKYLADTEIVKIPIDKLTRLKLEEWAYTMIKQYSMTKTKYYNVSSIVRQTLDYAMELDIIPINQLRNVKIKSNTFRTIVKKSDTSQVFTASELKDIKKLAMDDFNNSVQQYELSPLALLFMFQTGLRISEVCCVRYEDIEHESITIQRMYQRDTHKVITHTKGSYGIRTIALTAQAKEIIELAKSRQIERNKKPDGYIFSTDDNPCSYRSIECLFRKYCRILNIQMKSSHKARKTVISAMIDAGVNINTVRAMVGHTDERTTYRNYCYDRTEEDEKMQKIQNALVIQ